jgi:hypothetical protein
MSDFDASVLACRTDLDRWLTEAYADCEEMKYYGERDASYPDWHTIEDLVGAIFDAQAMRGLSIESQASVLFFISRNEEIGAIIAWLAQVPNSPFSHCGQLTELDFLFLCNRSLELPEDRSDYQLASAFHKFPALTAEHESLLLRFFNRKESYTRRVSLICLSHFRFAGIVELCLKLWNTDPCEYAKLNCLYALKEIKAERASFDRMLAEFEADSAVLRNPYMQNHIEGLRS